MRKVSILVVAAGLWTAGCSRQAPPAASEAREQQRAEAQPAPAARPLIVAFGDSLSAGLGAGEGHSFPDYLQAELDRLGYDYEVVNAGVNGGTTSGGLARVGDITAMKPAIVILELGANDGLRGLPVSSTEANLDQIMRILASAGAKIVLAGMTLPPNYGPVYIREFERIFPRLAAKHRAALIPFLLEGVAGTSRYMQDDGLHPTAEGNRLVARTVLKTLEPLLERGRR